MMDNNKIPEADQLWPDAEKMIDRHFRKRRIIIWFFSIAIPVLIGLSLMFNHSRNSAKNNITPGLIQNQSASVSKKSSPSIEADLKELLNKNSAPSDVKSQNDHSTANVNIAYNHSQFKKHQPTASVKIDKVNNSAVPQITSVHKKNISTGNEINLGSAMSEQKLNTTSGSVSNNNLQKSYTDDKTLTSENSDSNNNFLASNNNSVSSNEKMFFLNHFNPLLNINNIENEIANVSWPKKAKHLCNGMLGWEATVYGGAHYHQKNLSISTDAVNYIQHRKNEEEPVISPSVGLMISANLNSLSLSLGAEYSSYGEKTNYYPYSNQQTININNGWQTYTVFYLDTDTAYFTGNQLLLETQRHRVDSSFGNHSDTVEEYKYDQRIAEQNGVNKLYYIELPIELSYCIVKGKAGIGVSGGISPAWLVYSKGNYLRKDGRGLESFDEIDSFTKFLINGRLSVDFYYRLGARTKLVVRPQYKTNLNSIFKNDYGVSQHYNSTGILFGISYLLN